jgi:hypothetical protein
MAELPSDIGEYAKKAKLHYYVALDNNNAFTGIG